MITNIIYATRIHSGGGLIYLSILHKNLDKRNNLILLDSRSINKLKKFRKAKVISIKKNILADIKVFLIRLKTYFSFQYKNYFLIEKKNKLSELYLNGFPPLVRLPFVRNNVEIFCQNRLLFSAEHDRYFKTIDKLKHLFLKRLFYSLFIRKTDKLIAQTNTMKKIIESKYKSNKIIVNDKVWKELTKKNYKNGLRNQEKNIISEKMSNKIREVASDHIILFYPAHFYPHKNHLNLIKGFLEASISAKKPIKLLLTIHENNISSNYRNKKIIYFIGDIGYQYIQEIYKLVDFLIFPSLLESLGLPLIEAKLNNLPIICSDLEYVYEVCTPEKTFDPYSYKDISKSIKDIVENF